MQNTIKQEQDTRALAFLKSRFAFVRAIEHDHQTKTFLGRDRQSNQTVTITEIQPNQTETFRNHPDFIDIIQTPDNNPQNRWFLIQRFIAPDPPALTDENSPPKEPAYLNLTDAPRPEYLIAKFDDTKSKFNLKFPRAQNDSARTFVMFLVIAIFFTAGALACFATFKLFESSDYFDGFITGTFGLMFAASAALCAWTMINELLHQYSINIDETHLHHHRRTLLGLKTTSIPIKSIEVLEVKIESPNQTDKTKTAPPCIKISDRYNSFSLGETLPLDELNYWTSQIQKRLIASRNKTKPPASQP